MLPKVFLLSFARTRSRVDPSRRVSSRRGRLAFRVRSPGWGSSGREVARTASAKAVAFASRRDGLNADLELLRDAETDAAELNVEADVALDRCARDHAA
jgi:hypothetical protein